MNFKIIDKYLTKFNTRLLDYFKHAWTSGKRTKRLLKEVGPLNRVFSVADATFMSISSCISFTLYTHLVSETQRYGPLLSLAFILGSIQTSLTISCMAELVAKHPVSGSTYHFCYKYIGEFIGFMVGWCGIHTYFLDCVKTINGCSSTLDVVFFDNTLNKIFKKYLTIPRAPSFLRPYPILLSLFVGIAFSGTVAAKPKESKIANNLASMLNLCALSLLILLMAGQADIHKLGFMGAKYYAKEGPMSIFPAVTLALDHWKGIEGVAFLGDEVKQPHLNMPRSLFYSLIICNFYYISITLLFAMVVDYGHKGDASYTWIVLLTDLSFEETAWIPKIGSICALYSSVYTTLFWLSRLINAMSRDGLFFHALFTKVAHLTGTPVIAAFIIGTTAGICGTFISLGETTDMEVFSSLIMHVTAPICLLLLRYNDGTGENEEAGMDRLIFINHPSVKNPTKLTEQISTVLIAVIVISLALMAHVGMAFTKHDTDLARTMFILALLLFLGAFLCLRRQPQHKSSYYMINFVPSLPCVNILFIFVVMEYLWGHVWKFFLIYFTIGTLFYFSYSMHHSSEEVMYGRGKWYSLKDDTHLPQPESSIEFETVHQIIITKKDNIFLHKIRH
ncbi:hypothetical protein O3M35_012576 [Rhynocoris fuscipes]|uniref:Amino acid permease/ SLC12A domain-containing protein n=1 Tax=Rhynocoris fuscipes TaxID=488301 RepID=A0AAW1CSV4_9HEMI